jgi:hypothetical protein
MVLEVLSFNAQLERLVGPFKEEVFLCGLKQARVGQVGVKPAALFGGVTS